jgi:hypothetical protein
VEEEEGGGGCGGGVETTDPREDLGFDLFSKEKERWIDGRLSLSERRERYEKEQVRERRSKSKEPEQVGWKGGWKDGRMGLERWKRWNERGRGMIRRGSRVGVGERWM